MGKRGHSEEAILRVLREAESGDSLVEICRKISRCGATMAGRDGKIAGWFGFSGKVRGQVRRGHHRLAATRQDGPDTGPMRTVPGGNARSGTEKYHVHNPGEFQRRNQLCFRATGAVRPEKAAVLLIHFIFGVLYGRAVAPSRRVNRAELRTLTRSTIAVLQNQ